MARTDIVLQLCRGGAGVAATGALAEGLDFSTDGHRHELMTYVAFYGVGGLLVLLVIVLTVIIQRTKDGGVMASGDHPRIHIESHHQSGGITAQTVNVGAPAPTVTHEIIGSNEPTESLPPPDGPTALLPRDSIRSCWPRAVACIWKRLSRHHDWRRGCDVILSPGS